MGAEKLELSRVPELAAAAGKREMTVEGGCKVMAREELGGAKTTSCVISSDSKTVINPLPGYG
jgi:hypothetical protein